MSEQVIQHMKTHVTVMDLDVTVDLGHNYSAILKVHLGKFTEKKTSIFMKCLGQVHLTIKMPLSLFTQLQLMFISLCHHLFVFR